MTTQGEMRYAPPEEMDKDAIRFVPSEDVDDYIKSVSTLYRLVMECSWDALIERCKIAPEEAKQWVVRGSVESWRRLPLHEACIRQAGIEVIDALLVAFPLAAKSFDHSARLPIHHACFHGCSTEVVKKLMIAYPNGTEKKDVFEKTPVIIAESSSSKNKSEVVEILMKGAVECIIEEYRTKWEKDQGELLSKIREDFNQEKAAYETKIRSLTGEAKIHAHNCAKDLKVKNASIEELRKTVFDLSVRLKVSTGLETELKEKNKEMEERFSKLCANTHISSKKQQDKIKKQAEDIISKESKIVQLQTALQDLDEHVKEKAVAEEELKVEVIDLRGRLADQSVMIEEVSKENLRLQTELVQSIQELPSVCKQLRQSIDNENLLRSEVLELRNELESERLTLKKLQDERNTVQASEAVTSSTRKDSNVEGKLPLERTNKPQENFDFAELINKLNRRLKEKEAAIKSMEQSAAEARNTSAIRVGELKKQLDDVAISRSKTAKLYEEEKRQLILKISALDDEIEKLKDQVKKEQEKAQETIQMFQSDLRKVAVDRASSQSEMMNGLEWTLSLYSEVA